MKTAALMVALIGQQPPQAPADDAWYAGRLGWEWMYEGTGPKGAKNPVKKISDVEIVRSTECFVIEDTGFAGLLSRYSLDVSLKGVKIFRLAADTQNSFVFLHFPLKKGEKGEGEAIVVGQEKARFAYEVQAEEEIQVPAGKFKAMRVFWTMTQGASRTEVTSWYAPDQGEVARRVKVEGPAPDAYEFKLKEIQKKKISVMWRRPAEGCRCAQLLGKDVCKCLHCGGTDKSARCYCHQGGCKCGAQMPDCNCRHCCGMTGGDDGKGSCKCSSR